jgi:hypothetical protein
MVGELVVKGELKTQVAFQDIVVLVVVSLQTFKSPGNSTHMVTSQEVQGVPGTHKSGKATIVSVIGGRLVTFTVLA